MKRNTITIRLNMKAMLNHIDAHVFNGEMTERQKKGVNVFIDLWINRCGEGDFIPTAYLAYTLATVYHETAWTMEPLSEYGKGKDYPYGVVNPETGFAYYGRGYVQTTWDYNYKTLSTMVRHPDGSFADLYHNPELLLECDYSSQATLFGMRDGIYTGKRLTDYLDRELPDFVGARRVINGTDKADLIAGYAQVFWDAVNLAINYPVDRELVRRGSKNNVVRELQLALGLTPDRVFGSGTESAVKAFQRENGLAVDGVVGRGTWALLELKLRGE